MKKVLKVLNNNKNFVLGFVFIIGLAFVVGFGLTLASNDSTYLKNQNVDGLSFENAEMKKNDDGTYTFTVEVYNENKTTYNLKYVNMVFKDESGDETNLTGYVGESLESDEGRVITASTDKDLNETVSLTYTIQK